ncbi:HEAT repeat domain-containing protein [Candidatus Uabimicrobium amorphum]|uniref:HEAT repeat domain-containing protein n=1 Tax=Uabimicrobium amorphum TaxID=2596890 RepID=A0A5S9IHZ7_UABAM|nr:HEAT repeat domain-containing protein [Candidatus Uabimicrobium amorphum]BBM81891.1 hypothetical protein UABAM_00233 [Candidatus Uabimicrobium amorphum]
MIVFLCDQCQKIISEAELRNGSTRKKNGEVICGDCSVEQKNSRELFTCDRCTKKHSLDLLRTGKASLIKGKLYCHRCREFAEKTSREILDFKYLSAVFVLFLGIPMMIGSTMWLYRYMQNIQGNAVTPQENAMSEDMLRMQKQLKELTDVLMNKRTRSAVEEDNGDTQQDNTTADSSSQANDTPRNNTQPKKSLDDILGDLKKQQKQQNPQPQRPKSDNTVRNKIAQINLNIQKTFAGKLKSSDEAERVAAILQIMQNRERACIPLLVESLKDKSPLVRSFAAKALGSLGANKSIPQLLSNVSDKNIHVRRSIAKSLTMLTGRGFKDHQDLTNEDKQKLIDFINRER